MVVVVVVVGGGGMHCRRDEVAIMKTHTRIEEAGGLEVQ